MALESINDPESKSGMICTGGPDLLEEAPDGATVTDYDRAHFSIYAQLVTAHDSGMEWRDAASDILGLDCTGDELAARRCYCSHRDRALWIASDGYRMLLTEAGLTD